MTTSTLRTPVLVVGAGTVGAILALELAHHGVASIVVERGTGLPRRPDVGFLDGRSMELLRRLGLATKIRRNGVDPDSATNVVWSQGLDQPPVFVAQCPSINQLRGRYATVNDGSAPVEQHQQISETHLARQLRDALHDEKLVDLREGWTFTDLRIDCEGASATVMDARTGTGSVIKADYIAGCDGAQSTVRRCIEVSMDELQPPAQHCSVSFRNRDLSLWSHGPGLSTVIVGGVMLVSREERDTWVGHFRMAPDEPVAADPVELLHRRIGGCLGASEVLGVTQWDDSLAVAETYRQGPVFLLGEAAHRFHPIGNTVATGIGDAVDLGWKLAATLTGWAGGGLLDSYELERRPRALMDRELLARQMETLRRFSRLVDAGAPREFLAGILQQETHLLDGLGFRFGGRYTSSSVIWHERSSPSNLDGPKITPSTWPGGRAPAVRLTDGSQLFDCFGKQFTLVDLTDDAAGRDLVTAARSRGIPMLHLPLTDASVRACWDRRLVLLRPDQCIAWRDDVAPERWHDVLDLVSGHKTT
jgi:2-polyprenyl-6-methoxyphenol hydroxylase-like FAD-dependent oxidoreductase